MGVVVLPEGSSTASVVRGGRQGFTDPPTGSYWVRPPDWPALPVITSTDNKFVGLVAVSNDDANFLALNASVITNSAPTFASLTSGSSSTDASTYTTASVTLTAGRLYLFSIENSHGTAATAVSAITGSAASVPTFTSRGSTQFNSNLNRVSVWTAVPTANWTGTLTINFGGTTQTGACWSVVEAANVATTTNDGIVQVVTNTGSSATASVDLAALTHSGNATFGAQGHAAATATAPAGGYTEVHDVTTATPGQALQTQYLVPGSTTVSSTFTSAAWGIIGVEVARYYYTVTWGDGVTETVNSGTQANHQYTYSTLASPVTYRGYKTAVVTVTPNAAWTTLNLRVRHPQTNLNAYEAGWLDIVVSGPSLTSLSIGTSSETSVVRLRMLEQAQILSSALTSYANQFNLCSRLQSVLITSSAAVTSTAGMFANCSSLQTVPLFTTSSVTNMSTMFQNCSSLTTIPQFSTAANTSTSNMFDGCFALESIPQLDTTSVSNAGSMFLSCTSLAKGATSGIKAADISYTTANLSKDAVESIFDGLGSSPTAARTVTVSSNWGVPAVVSLSGTTTAGSTTVSMASTAGLSTDMEITGIGISTAVAVTFQEAGDTVTRTAHGLANGTQVSFPSIGLTSYGTSSVGPLATHTPYYVVNSATDTFQLADTVGGSAKSLSNQVAFLLVTSNYSNSVASSYTTASMTLVAGRMYLLAVGNTQTSTPYAAAISSVTGGAGVPTFTSRGSVAYDTNGQRRTSVWSAVPATDYTGTLTINFGGANQLAAAWSIIEVGGVDTATNDGVVQAVTNSGTNATPTVTLAALGDASNASFGALGVQSGAATLGVGSGYTLINTFGTNTPSTGLLNEYQSPGSTTVNATSSVNNWGMVALEIKRTTADQVGTMLYPTTISSIVANTSVTLSVPASASGTITTSSALLKRSKARLKGWTVTP